MLTAEIDGYVIDDFSAGEMKAHDIIYNYYREIVFSNINKSISRRDIAEDILQDVFIKLWENRNKFKDQKSLSAWLFRVSYNSSISYIRNELRERTKFADLALLNSDEKLVPDDSFQD